MERCLECCLQCLNVDFLPELIAVSEFGYTLGLSESVLAVCVWLLCLIHSSEKCGYLFFTKAVKDNTLEFNKNTSNLASTRL
jgi:hypothetical protein